MEIMKTYPMGNEGRVWKAARMTKGLYNKANFLIMQEFLNNKRIVSESEINNLLKDDNLYKALPLDTAKLVLKILLDKWNRYYESWKLWKAGKLQREPRSPRFRKKNGLWVVPFEGHQVKQEGRILNFPLLGDFVLPEKVTGNIKKASFVPSREGFLLQLRVQIPT